MYKYKIFNNIAQDGIDILNQNMNQDINNPDALLLRSQQLTAEDFNSNLKCVGRAGAGTNNIPLEDKSIPQTTSSFTAFAFAPGVLNTTTPFFVASSMGILFVPAPALPTHLRLLLAHY